MITEDIYETKINDGELWDIYDIHHGTPKNRLLAMLGSLGLEVTAKLDYCRYSAMPIKYVRLAFSPYAKKSDRFTDQFAEAVANCKMEQARQLIKDQVAKTDPESTFETPEHEEYKALRNAGLTQAEIKLTSPQLDLAFEYNTDAGGGRCHVRMYAVPTVGNLIFVIGSDSFRSWVVSTNDQFDRLQSMFFNIGSEAIEQIHNLSEEIIEEAVNNDN